MQPMVSFFGKGGASLGKESWFGYILGLIEFVPGVCVWARPEDPTKPF